MQKKHFLIIPTVLALLLSSQSYCFNKKTPPPIPKKTEALQREIDIKKYKKMLEARNLSVDAAKFFFYAIKEELKSTNSPFTREELLNLIEAIRKFHSDSKQLTDVIEAFIPEKEIAKSKLPPKPLLNRTGQIEFLLSNMRKNLIQVDGLKRLLTLLKQELIDINKGLKSILTREQLLNIVRDIQKKYELLDGDVRQLFGKDLEKELKETAKRPFTNKPKVKIPSEIEKLFAQKAQQGGQKTFGAPKTGQFSKKPLYIKYRSIIDESKLKTEDEKQVGPKKTQARNLARFIIGAPEKDTLLNLLNSGELKLLIGEIAKEILSFEEKQKTQFELARLIRLLLYIDKKFSQQRETIEEVMIKILGEELALNFISQVLMRSPEKRIQKEEEEKEKVRNVFAKYQLEDIEDKIMGLMAQYRTNRNALAFALEGLGINSLAKRALLEYFDKIFLKFFGGSAPQSQEQPKEKPEEKPDDSDLPPPDISGWN